MLRPYYEAQNIKPEPGLWDYVTDGLSSVNDYIWKASVVRPEGFNGDIIHDVLSIPYDYIYAAGANLASTALTIFADANNYLEEDLKIPTVYIPGAGAIGILAEASLLQASLKASSIGKLGAIKAASLGRLEAVDDGSKAFQYTLSAESANVRRLSDLDIPSARNSIRLDVIPERVVVPNSRNGSYLAEGDFGPLVKTFEPEPISVSGIQSAHSSARSVTEGGTGRAFAGHGTFFTPDGKIVVPDGTAITLPRNDISILDKTGRYIENGDWIGLANAAKRNERIANDIQGMTTWLPGAEIPNYTLSAPKKLNIYSRSTTADFSRLDKLLSPDMGCVNWAACTVNFDY